MLHYAFYFILSIRPPSTAAAYRESYRPSFLSDPAEASVCAVRGSHDSEDKHGAKGKNIPNRKEAKMGNSQSYILSLRVLNVIHYTFAIYVYSSYSRPTTQDKEYVHHSSHSICLWPALRGNGSGTSDLKVLQVN